MSHDLKYGPRGQNYNDNHTLPWENKTQNYWSKLWSLAVLTAQMFNWTFKRLFGRQYRDLKLSFLLGSVNTNDQ